MLSLVDKFIICINKGKYLNLVIALINIVSRQERYLKNVQYATTGLTLEAAQLQCTAI